MLSFIAKFTVENVAFSLISGFHAETLMTILNVKTSRHNFSVACAYKVEQYLNIPKV